MNQFLCDNIDQLDLALDQLAIKDRNFDRFAFMLIDNVVELTLHKFSQDKASANERWRSLGEEKYDAKVVARALGPNFDGKTKAAFKFGLIDEVTSESLLNLHSFRNTAYHQGLRHEGILHALAIFYFRIACKVLCAYEPGGFYWASTDKISHRALKYLGNTSSLGFLDEFRGAFQRLDWVAKSMGDDLVADLSKDMSSTIDAADENLDFLAGESDGGRDDAVVDAQLWPCLGSGAAEKFAKDKGVSQVNKKVFIDWVRENYPWSVSVDPIPGWKSRLDALRKESDNDKALKRYCDFMRQTEDIRSKITEAALQVDTYIQMQIDEARGK